MPASDPEAEGDEELLRCLARALAAADRLLVRPLASERLSEAERQLVLVLMADLSLTSAALARRSRDLERRITGVNSGLRAASSYQRTLSLTRPANRRQ